MLPGLEMMAACTDLAVPAQVMRHVAAVESSHNPYAIGVVGGRLVRQPRNLSEAVSTARMLEGKGMNFSLGIAQVNRYNLSRYGLGSYEQAFDVCPNVRAGASILAECYSRSGNDWGKAFSCYYSGNFTTGFRHGYVQKVLASIAGEGTGAGAAAIALAQPGRPAAGIAARRTIGDPGLVAHRSGPDLPDARALTAAPPVAQRRLATPGHAAPAAVLAAPVNAPVQPAQVAVTAAAPVQPLRITVNGRVQAAASAAAAASSALILPPGAAAPARDSALVF